MYTWTIEPVASPADIDAILAIEEASFTNPWTRAMYLAELENPDVSYCFLAKDPEAPSSASARSGVCWTSSTSTIWLCRQSIGAGASRRRC